MKTFIKLIILIGCILVAVTGTPIKNENENLNFVIPEEWSLVPDTTGRLRLLHISEIKLTEPENFFNPEEDIRILLFTRSNPTQPQIFKFEDATEVLKSNFNPEHPTKFTIHGWNSGINSGVNVAIAREYLKSGDHNMFTIDWSLGAATNNYVDARNRVRDVGKIVGYFINSLVDLGVLNPKTISIFGHSLGGHAAGMVAKNINGIPQSVFALDPAGPLFYLDQPHDRVDSEDAEYVQIIHTSGVLGFRQKIGDSDFYVNGGKSQPGCGADFFGACAHERAHQYFSESINSNIGFYATHCDSMEQMEAMNCDGQISIMNGTPAYGIFYLETSDSSPYALGPIT